MKKRILFILILLFSAVFLFALTNSKPVVDPFTCVGCGECTKFCPVDAIEIIDGKAVIDAEKCIDCKFCVSTCTHNAIE